MKKSNSILYSVLITILLCSCIEYGQNYNYKYKVRVTYTDSAVDTLEFNRDSFKGNKVYLYLKISESGLLSSGGTSPCLVIGCGFYKRTIVCGVRKFEILSSDTIALNDN